MNYASRHHPRENFFLAIEPFEIVEESLILLHRDLLKPDLRALYGVLEAPLYGILRPVL